MRVFVDAKVVASRTLDFPINTGNVLEGASGTITANENAQDHGSFLLAYFATWSRGLTISEIKQTRSAFEDVVRKRDPNAFQ
jgi:hypothetical protein